jgi:hypothetical protein
VDRGDLAQRAFHLRRGGLITWVGRVETLGQVGGLESLDCPSATVALLAWPARSLLIDGEHVIIGVRPSADVGSIAKG